ncbi:Hypothetical predicted protein, partial [Pelobates cultripes]
MTTTSSPTKLTQLSSQTPCHNDAADIEQWLKRLFENFWKKIQSHKQTAQRRQLDPLETGEGKLGQRE